MVFASFWRRFYFEVQRHEMQEEDMQKDQMGKETWVLQYYQDFIAEEKKVTQKF